MTESIMHNITISIKPLMKSKTSPAKIFGGVFQIGKSEYGENIGLTDTEMSISNIKNKTPIVRPHISF